MGCPTRKTRERAINVQEQAINVQKRAATRHRLVAPVGVKQASGDFFYMFLLLLQPTEMYGLPHMQNAKMSDKRA